MEELRLKIIDLCNQSGLPMEAIVFVVRDVYRDVNETFKMLLEEEVAKKEKEGAAAKEEK